MAKETLVCSRVADVPTAAKASHVRTCSPSGSFTAICWRHPGEVRRFKARVGARPFAACARWFNWPPPSPPVCAAGKTALGEFWRVGVRREACVPCCTREAAISWGLLLVVGLRAKAK